MLSKDNKKQLINLKEVDDTGWIDIPKKYMNDNIYLVYEETPIKYRVENGICHLKGIVYMQTDIANTNIIDAGILPKPKWGASRNMCTAQGSSVTRICVNPDSSLSLEWIRNFDGNITYPRWLAVWISYPVD